MLFDYLAFKEELRNHENPVKRKLMERWDKISSASIIEDEPYYAYLKKFKVNDIPYNVPESLTADFDWLLLFQLVAASFSSEYQLILPNLNEIDIKEDVLEKCLPELCISVKSGKVSVTKTVSELWSFQILRLYEIYLEEQMNLHFLMLSDENEKNAIEMEREMRVKKFKSWKQEYILYKNTVAQRNLRNKILDSLTFDSGKNEEN